MYYCERCNKLVTEKFGSGRFCSKSCANTRIQTHLQNLSRSNKLSKFIKSICKICGKEFIQPSYPGRKTCSYECMRLSCVQAGHLANSGGTRENSGNSKSGYYKGYYCGSTFELAFLIYCLDHNINIERCKEHFTYYVDNVKHEYYPDFKVNNTYIEIKGRYNELVDIKLKAVNNIIILYQNDLQICFDYLKENYNVNYNKGNNNFYLLYD